MSPPAGTRAVAFKEWAGVCDALIQGRQAIILRKGGISEGAGPGSFVPEHQEFWLYPTWVHQAEQGLRQVTGDAQPAHRATAGSVPIRALVRVALTGYVQSEAALPVLEEFHILAAETILKRFRYRKPGLWILGVRVWRREPEYMIASTPEHAGCKTWVVLDEPLSTAGLVPVLEDADIAARLKRLRSIVACPG
jgi:hypothetical protein